MHIQKFSSFPVPNKRRKGGGGDLIVKVGKFFRNLIKSGVIL